MASKAVCHIALLMLLIFVTENATAQFSPGKKPKESVVVEYRRVKEDTLRVRKSKLLPKKKRKSSAAVSDSVKGKNKKKTSKKTVAGKRSKNKVQKTDSVMFESPVYRLGDRIIMRGDSGADVRNVARILVKKIYMDEDSIIYTRNGDVLYEGELVEAVKRFQRLNGFYDDGIIGRDLIKALRKRK